MSSNRLCLQIVNYLTFFCFAFHQDYTQAEIAIFFLMCRRGGLFLAGDTAQSVVEGVEFRFEVRWLAPSSPAFHISDAIC